MSLVQTHASNDIFNSIVSFFNAKSDNDSSAPFRSLITLNVVQSVLKYFKNVYIPDEMKGYKRGYYAAFSTKGKATIAKYASENGVTAFIKTFQEN